MHHILVAAASEWLCGVPLDTSQTAAVSESLSVFCLPARQVAAACGALHLMVKQQL